MRCRTLTGAIIQVLHSQGRPLTYREIASQIAEECLWMRSGDGKPPSPWQVFDRVRRTPRPFVVDRSTSPHRVGLDRAGLDYDER